MSELVAARASRRVKPGAAAASRATPRWLGLLLLALPVWWALGVEQFVWLPVVGLGFAWVLLARRLDLLLPLPFLLFGLFLLAVLASSGGIEEPYRWLSFGKNFAALLLVWLLLVIVPNSVRDWRQLSPLVRLLAATLVLAAAAAVLAAFGLGTGGFQAPLGRLLPANVRATGFGELLEQRSLGRAAWNRLTGDYSRPTSFFLYPTHLASSLAVGLPMVVFCLRTARKKVRRAFWAVGALLSIAALLLTFSRTATIAVLLGTAFFLLVHSAWRIGWRLVALGLIAGLLLLTIVGMQELGIEESSTVWVEDLAALRGGDSAASRLATYRSTLQHLADRPWLGLGTERDLPDVDLPAGSHSLYLAVLYRHGILGLVLFVGFLVATWRSAKVPGSPAHPRDDREVTEFLRHCRWSFVIVAIDGVGTVPLTDATVMLLLGLILASGMTAGRLARLPGEVL